MTAIVLFIYIFFCTLICVYQSNKQITNCQMKSCNGLPCIIFNAMVPIIIHLVPLLYGCPISNEKVVLGSINEAVFLYLKSLVLLGTIG
jgi:hypothetical protein